jgi:hypothetical protein
MALALALAALSLPACKASLGDGDDGQPIGDGDDDTMDADDSADGVIDAAIDAEEPDAEEPDAPIDAAMPRPCVGGQQTLTTCFMKGTTPATATWANAKAACALIYPDAQLAKMASADDQAKVTLVAVGVTNTWIGANDITTEGTFLWADATPLAYTNWNDGEPNNGGGGEDCAVTAGDRNYEWDDRPCNTAYQYVCSYPLLPP